MERWVNWALAEVIYYAEQVFWLSSGLVFGIVITMIAMKWSQHAKSKEIYTVRVRTTNHKGSKHKGRSVNLYLRQKVESAKQAGLSASRYLRNYLHWSNRMVFVQGKAGNSIVADGDTTLDTANTVTEPDDQPTEEHS